MKIFQRSLKARLMKNASSTERKDSDKIKVGRFFELMENKNEENCRDLADVYLLIGQIYQYNNSPQESVSWLSKAVVVDDRYDVPYHSLAISCLNMGQTERAIRSLEQEIAVAPGNYYSYLLLADIFEKEGRPVDVEDTLKKLLARDPENIRRCTGLSGFTRAKIPVLTFDCSRDGCSQFPDDVTGWN